MVIRPPHPQNVTTTLPTVKMIVEVSKASAILTSANVVKLLRTKVTQPDLRIFYDTHFDT